MQPVCRSVPALRPPTPHPHGRGVTGTAYQVRVIARRGAVAARALRLRARAACVGPGGGGATEPAEAAQAQREDDAAAELVAEELEVLEEAAIAGNDEGRRPTDYDRRAHIFEVSSRVFRELKQRRDGDDVGDGARGGGTTAEAATHEQQQLG